MTPAGAAARPAGTAAVLVAGALAGLLLAAASPGHAHPLAPALLELAERDDGLVDVRWKTSKLRPRGTEIEPRLPGSCRTASEASFEEDAQSVSLVWQSACGARGLVGETIGVDGLGPVRIDVLLRVALADGRVYSAVLRAGDAAFVVPERQTASDVLAAYLKLGVEHILGGPDHLLFVLGLLLLVVKIGPLVKTITAFTLGHSVTLSLVALGIATVPSGPVELLIAISVLVLGVELASGREAGESLLRRRPWLMACAFGLLHGMGFAGALAEVGLPQEEIPLALFAFNVGIEIGQLLFVAMIAGAMALARRRLPAPPAWLVRVPAYGIGTFAAFWCFERAAELL